MWIWLQIRMSPSSILTQQQQSAAERDQKKCPWTKFLPEILAVWWRTSLTWPRAALQATQGGLAGNHRLEAGGSGLSQSCCLRVTGKNHLHQPTPSWCCPVLPLTKTQRGHTTIPTMEIIPVTPDFLFGWASFIYPRNHTVNPAVS